MKKVVLICLLLFGGWATAQSIGAAEYFIDGPDPGVGNGVPLTLNGNSGQLTQEFIVPTVGLSEGFHSLYVRTQVSTGNWGLYDRTIFFISKVSDETQNIATAEYFFDSDPGLGNGNSLGLNTNTGQLVQTFTIPTTGLSEGIHSIYVRTRNTDGNWSLYDRTIFYSGNFMNENESIDAVEYFFDGPDPGVGNGTILPLNENFGQLTHPIVLPTEGLTAGLHTVYIRTRTESGKWSLYDSAAFTVDPAAIDNTVTINENILTANFDTNGASYRWISCDTNVILDETERSFTATFSGNYAVEITFNEQTVISECIMVNIVNQNDEDNDGVEDGIDNCPSTFNPDQRDSDNDGEGDVCDNDSDNDGVEDQNDLCPDTLSGVVVDFNGCPLFSLPSNNYTIRTIGESCIESNNGQIELTAIEVLDYTAILRQGDVNQTVPFTQELTFPNLEAGFYQLCITIANEPSYEQCFDITVQEPEPISASSKVDSFGKTVTLNLTGSSTYFIELNGASFRTSENTITLPLNKVENTLNVTGDRGCQGSYNEIIVISENIMAYPNPVVQENVSVYLGSKDEFKTVNASIFSLSGAKVMNSQMDVVNGFIQINVSSLPEGVYVLNVSNKTTLFNHKIIKR